jgi:hypothetical protein
MRFVRAALAVTAALTLCLAIGVPAAGAAERDTSSAAKDRLVASAPCPPCVVRAATAIRAAASAPTIVSAGRVLKVVVKAIVAEINRVKVRRVQRDARRISRRPDRWVQQHWPRFRPDTKACLATIMFMELHRFLKDRMITRKEWRLYTAFGPRLVPPLETLSINFPMRFDAGKLGERAADEEITCAIGLGLARYFEK